MPTIRQSINIAAGPRSVWNALTTAEGLASWWVDEARIEPRAGGRLILVSEGDDGEPVEERGLIHAFRRTRQLEVAWDSNSAGPTAGTRVVFTIARDGGESRVSVIHRGGALDDEELHAEQVKLWRQSLRALQDYLEG